MQITVIVLQRIGRTGHWELVKGGESRRQSTKVWEQGRRGGPRAQPQDSIPGCSMQLSRLRPTHRCPPRWQVGLESSPCPLTTALGAGCIRQRVLPFSDLHKDTLWASWSVRGQLCPIGRKGRKTQVRARHRVPMCCAIKSSWSLSRHWLLSTYYVPTALLGAERTAEENLATVAALLELLFCRQKQNKVNVDATGTVVI